MAKPNYSFEKRQRELAKKKKKEEKLKDKAVRKSNPDGSDADGPGEAQEDTAPDAVAQPAGTPVAGDRSGT